MIMTILKVIQFALVDYMRIKTFNYGKFVFLLQHTLSCIIPYIIQFRHVITIYQCVTQTPVENPLC